MADKLRATRIALILAMALIMAAAPASQALAARTAALPNAPIGVAGACTVSPIIFPVYPHAVSAKVKWGPSCPTDSIFTVSLWEQTSPGNWNKEYGESFPNISNSGGNYYLMFHAWGCGGIGLWKARAYIGGQYVWSSTLYCP